MVVDLIMGLYHLMVQLWCTELCCASVVGCVLVIPAVSSGCKFSLQPEAFLCWYHLMYFLSPPGCKTVTFELFYPDLTSLLIVTTRCPPHQLCPCPVSAGMAPSGVTPSLFPPQSTLPCSGGTCVLTVAAVFTPAPAPALAGLDACNSFLGKFSWCVTTSGFLISETNSEQGFLSQIIPFLGDVLK